MKHLIILERIWLPLGVMPPPKKLIHLLVIPMLSRSELVLHRFLPGVTPLTDNGVAGQKSVWTYQRASLVLLPIWPLHLFCQHMTRRSKVRFAPALFYAHAQKSVIRPPPCSSFPDRNRLRWVAIWVEVQT